MFMVVVLTVLSVTCTVELMLVLTAVLMLCSACAMYTNTTVH
jgi:hypothetical protein